MDPCIEGLMKEPKYMSSANELVKALEQIQELQKALENFGMEAVRKEIRNGNGNENKIVCYLWGYFGVQFLSVDEYISQTHFVKFKLKSWFLAILVI